MLVSINNDVEQETVIMRFKTPITSILDNRLPDIVQLFNQRGYHVYYTDIVKASEYQKVDGYFLITVPVFKRYINSSSSLQSLKNLCSRITF